MHSAKGIWVHCSKYLPVVLKQKMRALVTSDAFYRHHLYMAYLLNEFHRGKYSMRIP